MPLAEIISLVLTAVLASIPVALPATFTLAAAVGARSLAHQGVLPTRLSAVDEAASIDVLCDELTVTTVRPLPGFNEARVQGLAALAGSDGGQDPVDAAIRSAAVRNSSSDLPKRMTLVSGSARLGIARMQFGASLGFRFPRRRYPVVPNRIFPTITKAASPAYR